MSNLKPMLAGEADLAKLTYPVVISPKLDGIRALVHNNTLLSRSLKSIPNRHIQKSLAIPELEGLDGELIIGSPTHKNVYNKTTSGVMSFEGEPEFTYFVFDYHNLDLPFRDRYKMLHLALEHHDRVKVVPHSTARNEDELLQLEEKIVSYGFEGVMLRHPEGRYKYGRSTQREGILLKLKRFKDSEAVIIGFEERMHNANEMVRNELGYADRSSAKAGLVPTNSLGAFVVVDNDVQFNIGTGLTEQQRRTFWEKRESLLGQVVKYKYFEVGVKIAPRHPSFIGFRDAIDM